MASPNESAAFLTLPVLQVASSNAGKIAEFQLGLRLWTEQGTTTRKHEGQLTEWVVQPVPGIDRLAPCVEDEESFAANARKKALHYSRLVSGLVLGDDSGLEVDALGGAPGVRSRRFAGPHVTDAQNNAKLLRELLRVPAERRTARFVCVLALARDAEILAQFTGQAYGLILESPRGTNGFGYDPLFLDQQSNRSFAEFSPEEKLQRSHRGRALRALLEWLAGDRQ